MEILAVEDLVAEAKRALGRDGTLASDSDVAFELRRRFGLRHGQSLVNRWANGKARPNYEATLALLAIAGWLEVGGAEGRPRAGDVSAADLVPYLRQIGDGLETLDALVSGRSQPAPQPKRRPRRAANGHR